MGSWVGKLGVSREAVILSLRAMVAAVVSMLLARGLKQPEFYWAPISTIVILLSTTNPMTLALAATLWERRWERW